MSLYYSMLNKSRQIAPLNPRNPQQQRNTGQTKLLVYTFFGMKGIPGADPPSYVVLRAVPFQIVSKMLRLRAVVLANTVLFFFSGNFANFH